MGDPEVYCARCETVLAFEVPPCGDGHDVDCPELTCTGCGAALVVAPTTIRVWLRPGGSAVAPKQRRAAA